MAAIVVIDDEPIVLELIGAVLRLDGHDMMELADPIVAYEVITNAQLPIDLVITDADLRPISGFELVNRLRQKRVGCPVLVVSGHLGLAAVITESLGHVGILEKPFTAAGLRSAVHKVFLENKAKSHHAP